MNERYIAWHKLRAVRDPSLLPELVRQLLEAPDEDDAYTGFEHIEASVSPGRELYEAAEAVTRSLVSRVVSGVCSSAAVDLLVEIAHGEPSVVELIEGNDGVALRCAELIRGVLPQLYALARAREDESFRQGVIDLATRLEPVRRVREELLEEFSRDARGVYLQRSLKDLAVHLDAPTLSPGALPGRAGSLAELLQDCSEWRFWRVFRLDVGGRLGRLGMAMQFSGDGEEAALRVVCEGVTGLWCRGTLALVDGNLEVVEDAGAWLVNLQQGDLQVQVRCAGVRMVDPWAGVGEGMKAAGEGEYRD